MRKHSHKLIPAVFLSLLCLGFSCNDKPFEPVEPKDYPFYFSDASTAQLFAFRPATMKLDSVALPWDGGVTVSVDGKLFYVTLGTSVMVVDADSLSVITELFYPHNGVSVSPDNKYLALTGNDLYIIRTSDYSLVFSDTTEIQYWRGSFSSNSKAFYCVARPNSGNLNFVFSADLSDTTFSITKKTFDPGDVFQVIPSIDESKWFLYLNVALWTAAFEVYDVSTDSIIFSDILFPWGGSMAASPDGKYVFYTNPGRTATDPPPDLSFKVYNVESNAIEKVVSDTSFFCFGSGCAPPKHLAVSPDNRWLGILGGDIFLLPAFYLYDINSGKLIYREIGNFPTVIRQFRSNMSIQKLK